MSFLTVNNVNIIGISAAVPKNLVKNTDSKFINTTGVEEKRVTLDHCASDLCFESADKLLEDLKLDRSGIQLLIFVSQTPNYKLPITSAILQDRLKLSESCICLDIPLGCSGYVYGLYVASSLISSGQIKKGLLLVGDTISKEIEDTDISTKDLFGDSGTCTILEYDEYANPLNFGLGTDGSGYESIIIRGGGSKERESSPYLKLDGVGVFNFGINKIPKIVKDFMSHFKISVEEIDKFIFHQANKLMNDKIIKKLNIPQEKSLSSIKSFGNTSSATIPLTIVTEHKESESEEHLLFCGFGVGLSWATVSYKKIKKFRILDLIEL